MGRHNPAQRRYLTRFMPLMVGYVLILIGVNRYVDTHVVGRTLLGVLALLPALPLVGVIAAMGLYLRDERDEFIRNRLVVSMLWGTGMLLSVATIWGFMENTGIVGHPPTFLAFPLWCGAMGLAQGVMALRDRWAGSPE